MPAAAAEEHRRRNGARVADDVDEGRRRVDAVEVGHLAKQADLLDQDVGRLLQEVGEEVDCPIRAARDGAPARALWVRRG